MSAQIIHFPDMSALPNRIRELRKLRGWSQDYLAERIGCSKMQISGLERGKPRLTPDWMRRVAGALQVDPAELLAEDDNPLRLTAEERALIEMLRAADDQHRETAYRVAEAALGFRSEPSKAA